MWDLFIQLPYRHRYPPFAWQGQIIQESHCLTCGECVQRCPRGALRITKSNHPSSQLNN
jgi:ferredoxin